MSRPDRPRKNVLPNTYIPVLSHKTLVAVLGRLPKKSLVELAYIWPKIVNTQPHQTSKQLSQKDYNRVVSQKFAEWRDSRANKAHIIDRVLLEFWSKGLNLLQLSQVDCQLIVDRPNSYSWVSSVVHDSHGEEAPISLEPKAFLDALVADLSKLFLTYVYICRHPKFPLIIIRIQVFDLQDATVNASRPHIVSHKPYFLAIPVNSPYVIHSPGNDLVKNIVLQVVERNLPQSPHNLLRLVSSDQTPVKSLEAMHIFLGSSRFGNSLGAWTPYADNTVDISPLSNVEEHASLKGSKLDSSLSELRQVANLRFKGTVDGKLKSDKLFDQAETLDRSKRRKKSFKIYEDNLDDDAEANNYKDEFSSVAPVQAAEFSLEEKFDDGAQSSITLKLFGSDVFAGLHELSVKSEDPDEMVVDPRRIPGWLTGEGGRSIGVVTNGKLTSR